MSLTVGLAQINPIVGDVCGNSAKIAQRIREARDAGARLVVFPELAVMGYPPKDLVLRADLVRRNADAIVELARDCRDVCAVVGFVEPAPGSTIFNAAAVCRDGRVQRVYRKALLPTYDVFDECRYFGEGNELCIFPFHDQENELTIGVTICEDLWNDYQFDGRRVYAADPVARTVAAGAQVLLNLSASPFQAGKQQARESIFGGQIREHRVPLVYVNQVGGNDDLIFDGGSLVMDVNGRVVARARTFEEDLLIVRLGDEASSRNEPYPDRIESVRRALVLGLRDYACKCGFQHVLLGLSGGIDSALTAALAVEAVGSQNVHGVALPSRYSSDHSLEDARALAEALRIDFDVIPIEPLHSSFEAALRPRFGDRPPDLTEENLQARIRGNLLMALSNKFNWLLITTGNKSELAVGYCTLYGDMCGGLALISDVPKTVVYELARHINQSAGRELIPQRSIDKPPSAELRANQLDTDSLPSYDTLDAILEQYIEREAGIESIVAAGFDRDTVNRIVRMVERSEYKRKQSPIGIRVTSRAFGTGRRVPIAMRGG